MLESYWYDDKSWGWRNFFFFFFFNVTSYTQKCSEALHSEQPGLSLKILALFLPCDSQGLCSTRDVMGSGHMQDMPLNHYIHYIMSLPPGNSFLLFAFSFSGPYLAVLRAYYCLCTQESLLLGLRDPIWISHLHKCSVHYNISLVQEKHFFILGFYLMFYSWSCGLQNHS